VFENLIHSELERIHKWRRIFVRDGDERF